MAEIPQDLKDQVFAITKKHLPDVDDATINAMLDEALALVNEQLSQVVILPR